MKYLKNIDLIILLLLSSIITLSCSSKQKKEEWIFSKKVNKIFQYEDFIKKYPRSNYIDSAKILIEQLRYYQAININTIPYYLDFLKKYPNSDLCPNISNKLNKIYKERNINFQNAEKYKVLIYQNFENSNDINHRSFYTEPAEEILEYAGLTKDTMSSSKSDISVIINVIGKPIGAYYYTNYQRDSTEYHLSGAEIYGSIKVETKTEEIIFEGTFKGIHNPSNKITRKYETPESEIFYYAFEESNYINTLCILLGDAFGYNCIAHFTITNEHPNIRENCIKVIADKKYNMTSTLVSILTNKENFKGIYLYESDAAYLLSEIIDTTATIPLLNAFMSANYISNSQLLSNASKALCRYNDKRVIESLEHLVKQDNIDKIKKKFAIEILNTIK